MSVMIQIKSKKSSVEMETKWGDEKRKPLTTANHDKEICDIVDT